MNQTSFFENTTNDVELSGCRKRTSARPDTRGGGNRALFDSLASNSPAPEETAAAGEPKSGPGPNETIPDLHLAESVKTSLPDSGEQTMIKVTWPVVITWPSTKPEGAMPPQWKRLPDGRLVATYQNITELRASIQTLQLFAVAESLGGVAAQQITVLNAK